MPNLCVGVTEDYIAQELVQYYNQHCFFLSDAGTHAEMNNSGTLRAPTEFVAACNNVKTQQKRLLDIKGNAFPTCIHILPGHVTAAGITGSIANYLLNLFLCELTSYTFDHFPV